jgi:uncharacterized protein YutE (UPF0331/DUF86 family)
LTPGTISEKVVAQRAWLIEEMLRGIRALPLDSYERFIDDSRNPAAADSYLRRALEALLDLGRHILAKGLGRAVSEYKDVPRQLQAAGVLDEDSARRMTNMAGYRNRLVHFYDEVTPQELYALCAQRLGDITALVNTMTAWVRSHPEMLDRSL